MDEVYAALEKVDDLLASTARKFDVPGATHDDLLQEARVEFMKQYHKWSASRCALSTFACNAAKWGIMKYARQNGSLIRIPAWIYDKGEHEDRAKLLLDAHHDMDSIMGLGYKVMDEVDERIWMNGILEELPKRHRDIMRAILSGESHVAVADQHGVTAGRIGAIKRNCMMKLRDLSFPRKPYLPKAKRPSAVS